MLSDHPLDRPIWSALTSRQAWLARGDGRALGFERDYGMFGAAAENTPEGLAALASLVPADGQLTMIEAGDWPAPPGTAAAVRAPAHQMIAEALTPGRPGFEALDLGEDDAAQMLALARLTEPGPFFARTHQLGRFVGVKQDARLVAMAGERMQPDGFTEVSAVCTHPDYRGRGYARGLMRVVAERILARGETAFLHCYSSNTGAIALYESLGFRLRRQMTIMVVQKA